MNNIKTISLKDYDKIPTMYDSGGDFRKMGLKAGDYYILRERDNLVSSGDVVSVYEVIRLTDNGHESKITMLRIE